MGSESISSSSSSSSSSSYSSAYIKNYIKDKNIVSCCIGLSYLSQENYAQKLADKVAGKYYTHSSLWLSDKKYEDEDNAYGLILEYGHYDQEYDIQFCVDDQNKIKIMKVKKSCVIYQYEEKGGLRYYAKRYQDYRNFFGSVAYVELDVEEKNQIMFIDFLNKLAPKNEDKWTKEKYHFYDHNCQNFTAEALKILKPTFRPKDIKVNDNRKLSGKKRESILPNCILEALQSK